MNDTVTILTTATGKYITKAFRGPHYQAVQFNPGSEFLVKQIPVNNLESLTTFNRALDRHGNVKKAMVALGKSTAKPKRVKL